MNVGKFFRGFLSGWRGVGLGKVVYFRNRNGQGICVLGYINIKVLRQEKASWCYLGMKTFKEMVEVVEVKEGKVGQGEGCNLILEDMDEIQRGNLQGIEVQCLEVILNREQVGGRNDWRLVVFR